MSRPTHRHDRFHRGEVPSSQLAGGTPVTGNVPVYQDDGSVDWTAPDAIHRGDHDELYALARNRLIAHEAAANPHSGYATDADLSDHLTDAVDAHDASAVSISDVAGYYTGIDVEAALQEIGAGGIGGGGGGHILLADGHAAPFAFNDMLQMDDGSDFMWSD